MRGVDPVMVHGVIQLVLLLPIYHIIPTTVQQIAKLRNLKFISFHSDYVFALTNSKLKLPFIQGSENEDLTFYLDSLLGPGYCPT